MKLASILGIPSNNGICEYIKEVWKESRYTKPLEMTRNFANDNTIMAARRVKSVEMKPFQRFIHFLVMKNVVPQFGKRDTSNYMDLIYMDHLIARRFVNVPRVMMRHMSYVILVKDHELPYGRMECGGLVLERIEKGMMRLKLRLKRFMRKKKFRMILIAWEAVIDEAAVQGESGSDDQFFDAQVDVEEPVIETLAVSAFPASPGDSTNQQKE
ncbi:hypothetical protein Dimus_005729 [Dionaea muscipula]